MEVILTRTSPVLLLALMTGCTWVTSSELAEVLEHVDTDGDGWEDSLDCRPLDASVHPRGEDLGNGCYTETETGAEVADGIDNDCSCGDQVDGDGDGYAPIPQTTYEALLASLGDEAPPGAGWPAGVIEGDCDDEDPDTFPGAPDVSHDGVDSDCGCAQGLLQSACNDFDADLDGFVDQFADRSLSDPFFAAHPELVIPAERMYTDCDDDDPQIRPGAAEDPPYDGVDADCDGSNDFDADGDGYTRAGDEEALAAFIAAYHPDTAPDGPTTWGPDGLGTTVTGDCLDRLPPGAWIPDVDPFDIHPNAFDAFADGIDADCDGSNDYDADGDGVAAPGVTLEQLQTYKRNWDGYDVTDATTTGFPDTIDTLEPVLDDCDDGDPTVYPGQVEPWFSQDIDHDCDGGPTTTRAGFGGYLWDHPTQPRAIVTSSYVILGISAKGSLPPPTVVDPGFIEWPALSLRFDAATARSSDVPTQQHWDPITSDAGRKHGGAFDMVADGDAFWVASSFYLDTPQGPKLRHAVSRHLPVAQGFGFSIRFSTNLRVPTSPGLDADLDASVVGDELWIASSGGAGRAFAADGSLIFTDAAGNEVPNPTGPGVMRTSVVDMNDFDTFGLEWVQDSQNSTQMDGVDEFLLDDGEVCLLVPGTPGSDSASTLSCDDDLCAVFDASLTGDPVLSADTFAENGVIEADHQDGLLVLVPADGGLTVIPDDLQGTPYSFLDGQPVLSGDALWVDTTGDDVEDTLFVAAVVAGDPNTLLVGSTTDPAIAPSFVALDPNDTESDVTHCVDPTASPTDCATTTGRTLEPLRVELAGNRHRLAVVYTAESLDTPVAPAGQAQDALGWAFFSYFLDSDGDGYPSQPVDGPTLDPSLADPDDSDPNVVPPTP